MANRIKKNSRKHYAKPRRVVEREIEDRASRMLKEVEIKPYQKKN
jgi:hypothetical protein